MKDEDVEIYDIAKSKIEWLDLNGNEEFEEFISYHLKTCERKDLLGASAHNLDIVRVKEDE